jgi:acyl-CoA synthetase (AMP-forming)/AMP-acid ligase II
MSSSLAPEPPPASTFIEVVRRHAATRPSHVYMTYLADGERPETTLTYAELNARVHELAARLARHAQPGDRALLLYPKGSDFVVAFLACLAARMVAVPAYPPRNQRHLPRIEAILRDAGARLVLTVEQARERTGAWLAGQRAEVTVLYTDR